MVKSKPSPPSKRARVCRVSIWEAQTSGGGPSGPPARAHTWRGDTFCLWAYTHFANRTARVNEGRETCQELVTVNCLHRECILSHLTPDAHPEQNVDRAEAAKRLRAQLSRGHTCSRVWRPDPSTMGASALAADGPRRGGSGGAGITRPQLPPPSGTSTTPPGGRSAGAESRCAALSGSAVGRPEPAWFPVVTEGNGGPVLAHDSAPTDTLPANLPERGSPGAPRAGWASFSGPGKANLPGRGISCSQWSGTRRM